jgi:hypothetical protein
MTMRLFRGATGCRVTTQIAARVAGPLAGRRVTTREN